MKIKPPVFILSMGRSGSMFMANLLAGCNGVNVQHEPEELNKIDIAAYKKGIISSQWLLDPFRVGHVNEQINKGPLYIEVNGYLRNHVKALKAEWPDCKIMQLVRNPKDVIRSMASRNPSSMIRFLADHHRVSIFYASCFFWQLENRKLRRNADFIIRLEDILEDYSHYHELLEFLGLEKRKTLYKDVWEKLRKKPVNKTIKYRMPAFNEWSKIEKEIFLKNCEKEGKAYGYRMAD